jgi:iron complex outermembrane receptor protein
MERRIPMKFKKLAVPCLAALAGAALPSGAARAHHEPQHLEKVEVVDQASNISLTNPSAEQAKEELKKVPGATTLIKNEDFVNRANTGGLADVLARTPGVFSESRFGNQESRIAIRGSGITMTFGTRGVRYLRDGLPLINADGFGSPELFEPMTAEHIEVYRGANALQYGSATLGGAVNLVSKTGRTYNGYGLNMVYGSHDYIRSQVQAGGVVGDDFDYYATYTGSYTDGFREQSREDIHRFFGNMGYRWDERNETRFYFTASQNRLELPGSLPLEDQAPSTININGVVTPFTQLGFQHHPGTANRSAVFNDQTRNFDVLRGDLKHTLLLGDDDRLDVGGWYEWKRFDHPIPDVNNLHYDNAGGSFRYLQNDNLWGHGNHLTVGGFLAWGDAHGNRTCRITQINCANNVGLPPGTLSSGTFNESWTLEGFLEDRFELNDQFDAVAGMQAVWAKRDKWENIVTTNATVIPATPRPRLEAADEEYSGWSPKLGLIWKAAPGIEVYGNASRSYEPPSNSDFASFQRLSATVNGMVVLDGQEGTSIELGVRGEKGIFSWDVAAYHTWLRDEMLQGQNPFLPPGTGGTIGMNAKDTTHSGVEASASALIPVGMWGEDKLRLSVLYNYTRFLFKNDERFGDNYLPGIPNHFGQGEALYEHPSGFYVGPNVKMANDYFVDFANTNSQKAPAYTILGARAGYKSKDHWAVFVEGRNLTDENWVSNTSVVGTATAATAAYNPGYDRQVIGGFSVDFF